MNGLYHRVTQYLLGATLVILIGLASGGCGRHRDLPKEEKSLKSDTLSSHPVVYFEIPVQNMDRAIRFYEGVFQFTFKKEYIDGYSMALFPFEDTQSGITGALAKGDVYQPTKSGVLLYFATDSIQVTLRKATDHGGKVLYPIQDNGVGLVAEFEDSEGNRIALFQAKKAKLNPGGN